MNKSSQALYELANLALSDSLDDRCHASVDVLSNKIGSSRSTTGRAVQRMCSVGAAEWVTKCGGRLKVLKLSSKFRAVDVYKTSWHRDDEILGFVTEETAQRLVRQGEAVWGGYRAAIAHMNGYVPASPYTSSIYVLDGTVEVQDSGEVPVYRWMTAVLPGEGIATAVQTLTELFNTPGWLSGDFYQALWDRKVAEKW